MSDSTAEGGLEVRRVPDAWIIRVSDEAAFDGFRIDLSGRTAKLAPAEPGDGVAILSSAGSSDL